MEMPKKAVYEKLKIFARTGKLKELLKMIGKLNDASFSGDDVPGVITITVTQTIGSTTRTDATIEWA